MTPIALKVDPGCGDPNRRVNYVVPVEILGLGLDPKTAKIFVQLQ